MKLTQQVHQQKLIELAHVDALMKMWKCEHVSCPNHDSGGWCYDAHGVHLKLMHVHLHSWSIVINNEDATLDSPPSNLPLSLPPSRHSEQNPLIKKSTPPPTHSNASNTSIVTIPRLPGLPYPGYIPYQPTGYPPHYPEYYPSSLQRRSPHQGS